MLLPLSSAATGCHAPQPPESPTMVTVPSRDFDGVWDEALESLRRLGFEPEREDRVNSVIVTEPVTSAQWFEFWRGDVADPYSLSESSLHTVQRRITVRLIQVRETEPWTIDVRVDVFRLSTPERQITSASGGLNLFSSRVPTTGGQIIGSVEEAIRWVPLGRDSAMEQRVANRLRQSCEATGAGV